MSRQPLTDGQFEKAIWILLGVCLLLGIGVLGVVVWAVVRVVLRFAP